MTLTNKQIRSTYFGKAPNVHIQSPGIHILDTNSGAIFLISIPIYLLQNDKCQLIDIAHTMPLLSVAE